jgi:hypothetical protein
MKYIKTYEKWFKNLFKKEKEIEPKVGDHAILKSSTTLNIDVTDFYGVIIDTGIYTSHIGLDVNLYLIDLLNDMDSDTVETLSSRYRNMFDEVKPDNLSEKSDWYFSKRCIWLHSGSFKNYTNEDEWKRDVETIKMKQDAVKYNL